MVSTQVHHVLVADDDADDRMLIEDAFDESGVDAKIEFVGDGAEALRYLRCEGEYAERSDRSPPSLIFLDLNMPILDGRAVIREIRRDTRLSAIPVTMLSTSNAKEDIRELHELGANSYIIKPMKFQELVKAVRVSSDYWLDVVAQPA